MLNIGETPARSAEVGMAIQRMQHLSPGFRCRPAASASAGTGRNARRRSRRVRSRDQCTATGQQRAFCSEEGTRIAIHMNPGQHDGSDHRTGHVAVRPDVAKSLAIGRTSTRPVMRRPSANRTPIDQGLVPARCDECVHSRRLQQAYTRETTGSVSRRIAQSRSVSRIAADDAAARCDPRASGDRETVRPEGAQIA